MRTRSPKYRRSCLIHDPGLKVCITPESATGSGRRRNATTGHALSHVAHHWFVIRSHAAILGSAICRFEYPTGERIGQ
jgi:hypothetical protein